MAEIRVRRKRKSGWPWILGVILLGLAVYFIIDATDLVEFDNSEETTYSENEALEDNQQTSPYQMDSINEVNDYQEWVQDSVINNDDLNTKIVNSGLNHLSLAIHEVIAKHELEDEQILKNVQNVQQRNDIEPVMELYGMNFRLELSPTVQDAIRAIRDGTPAK